MRRALLLFAMLVTALLGAEGSAWAVGADKAPSLGARLTACVTGADDSARAAAFTGAMPAASGTRRMMMRFSLQQRVGPGPKGTFKRVTVPGWGGWEKSDSGRRGFVFTKRIEALTAPAAYRASVTFRWLDAKGHAQRTTTRTSAACEQPDPRPNLVLGAFDAQPAGPSTAAYTISVDNDGHALAEEFAVTVTVDGVVSSPLMLGPVDEGARVTGTVAAPRCVAGTTVTVTIDVAGAVDESVEPDDVVQRPCPLA